VDTVVDFEVDLEEATALVEIIEVALEEATMIEQLTHGNSTMIPVLLSAATVMRWDIQSTPARN
jgi:hypothetical protein